MNKLIKRETLKELQQLKRRLTILKSKRRPDAEFLKWHHDVEVSISLIFQELPHHIEAFKKITFEPLLPMLEHMDILDTRGEAFKEGLQKAQAFLESRIYEVKKYWQDKATPNSTEARRKKKIFIVHGHDEETIRSVVAILENLEQEFVILHEQPNLGRTIIEKLEEQSMDISFVIVILSPDDLACDRGEPSTQPRPRARQNVVFELGLFIGKLGRKNVFLLYKKEEGFEFPSDYEGVVYTPYDKTDKWKLALMKELKARGFSINSNKLY